MYVKKAENWFIPEFVEPEKRVASNSLRAFEAKYGGKGRLHKTYRFDDGGICRVFVFTDIMAPCQVCGQLTLSKALFVGVDEKGFISGYWKKCDKCQALLDAKERSYTINIDEMALLSLREAGVPDYYLNCRLDNFQPQEITEGISTLNTLKTFSYRPEYGEKATNALMLIGRTGVGKTHLAVAAMYNFFRSNNGKNGRYIKQSALMEEIRDSYSKKTSSTVLTSFSMYDILVIDEVGRLQTTSNNQNVLQEIVQARIEYGLKTILCGNINPEEIETVLGEQNVSRFKAAGKILTIIGGDFREKYKTL